MVLLRESIMKQQLLKEIELGSKNALIKKRIITHYIYNGSSTITDLSKELDLSIPTVTKFIGEMYEDGYINDYGKLETSGGRHPSLYGLNPESGYFIGVDIKRFAVNIGLINFKGDMMELKMNIPYKFENTPEAKEELCRLISSFIKKAKVNSRQNKHNNDHGTMLTHDLDPFFQKTNQRICNHSNDPRYDDW